MSDNSAIEWTDASWTPIRARNKRTGKVGWHCEHATTGCEFCYAEGFNKRLGTGLAFKPGHRDDIDLFLDQEMLTLPLRWKKPRKIFVCSMTDLFADFVPDEWIDQVFAVMALCPQHTFQCLTKRAERMCTYCCGADVTQRIAQAMDAILVDLDHDPVEHWNSIPGFEAYEASTHGRIRRDGAILQEQINPVSGRPTITLWRDNEPSTEFVHTLVLLAHVGTPEEGHEARHRNGRKTDNRFANLRWGTRSENQDDKVRHGSSGGPAKLMREQVAEIRDARKRGEKQQALANRYGVARSLISMIESQRVWPDAIQWPLGNVWKGVSTERQQEADDRIPLLLQTPAAIRFISAEPLLGPLDLSELHGPDTAAVGHPLVDAGAMRLIEGLDWVIVGGESGRGARAMHPAWARSLRDQCLGAGVPFFFKQFGEWAPSTPERAASNPHSGWKALAAYPHVAKAAELYPESGAEFVARVGKKRAGRLLDGQTHNGMPDAIT